MQSIFSFSDDLFTHLLPSDLLWHILELTVALLIKKKNPTTTDTHNQNKYHYPRRSELHHSCLTESYRRCSDGKGATLLVQWGGKSELGVSIFLKSIWVLMEPWIMHSVGRFLRLAPFLVGRRRRWGRLRLNPYWYERLYPHQEFQRSCFHTTVPDSQVVPTTGQ